MKRIHLFEFEDQAWFPGPIRAAMTDFLSFMGSLASGPTSASRRSFAMRWQRWARGRSSISAPAALGRR